MRAGRLVHLLRLLQTRGQMTAGALATELEVTVRTVLRDIEALGSAGVPVYSVRGPNGGYALRTEQDDPPVPDGWLRSPQRGAGGRAVVALSPLGRRMAVLGGRPAGLRVRRPRRPTSRNDGWVEASFPVTSVESALYDILTLGAEVEVVQPMALRSLLADTARLIAERNATR